jgi:transcriptional repressor NrdR
MRCPFCGQEKDRVVDSRTSQNGRSVRRRRECESCKKRFTTYEYVEDVSLTIIKNDDPSKDVGKEVMRRLKELDEVAYVRFASVYHKFKDINEFMDELKGLLKRV